METMTAFIFLGSKISADGTAAMKLKDACFLEEKLGQPTECIKKQRHYLANKAPYNQSYGFFGSHVWIWELDHKEGWMLKNWCFWTVKTLESSLDCKEIEPVNPKADQPWIFIGRTDANWWKWNQHFSHLMRRADSLEKTLMLGKIKGRRRRGQQRVRWLDGITDSTDKNLSKDREMWWTGKPGVLQSMGSQRVGHDWVSEQQRFENGGFPGGASGKESACNAGDERGVSLGRTLEKEMATCSSFLAWEIPWIEEPGGLQSTGSQESKTRPSD